MDNFKPREGKTMDEVTSYPIDFDALEKGSYIQPEVLEHVFQVKRDMAAYSLKLVAMRDEIMRQLSARGLDVVAKQHNSGIKILEDAEASAYTYQSAQLGVMKYHRNLVRAQSVDRSQLDDKEKELHDGRLFVMGRVYQAAFKAKKEARKLLSAPAPEVPSLLAPPD